MSENKEDDSADEKLKEIEKLKAENEELKAKLEEDSEDIESIIESKIQETLKRTRKKTPEPNKTDKPDKYTEDFGIWV